MKKLLLLLAAVCIAASAVEMKILRNDLVLDVLPGNPPGMSPNNPGGIVRTANGEYITVIRSGGDYVSDANYLYGSSDGGRNWSLVKEFRAEDPLCGRYVSLYQLPDGGALLVETLIRHKRRPKDYVDMVKNNLRDYMTLDFYYSKDGGRTLEHLQQVVPPNTLGNATVAGNLIKLANGDLLVPAYCGNPKKGGLTVGSGFFRSTDNGKTWGPFERAFFPKPGDENVVFNESTFCVNDDGTVIAYARTDTANQYVEPMYKAVSRDHGKTWSQAEKTDMLGIYPFSLKLDNGLWLLMAGIRNDRYRDRVIQFFVSEDGENWTFVGRPYHFKPEDGDGLSEPKWGQTGGAQAMMQVEPNVVYVIFSAGDLHLNAPFFKYVDGNLIEIKR